MNRRTFFATTIGALIAAILPAKKNLKPGDMVTFKCIYGHDSEPHEVTYLDERNILIECTPHGACEYPVTHWLPRDWKLNRAA